MLITHRYNQQSSIIRFMKKIFATRSGKVNKRKQERKEYLFWDKLS